MLPLMKDSLVLDVWLAVAACAGAAEPHCLTVDFAVAQGELRALHGINKGR